MVGVRLQPDQLDAVDQWADKEPDKPSRPEAIRRLVKKALGID
ncbi:ribbon-helix-helix protein, CopG family [Novosphingobium resinovorum]|nr:ribbon-helix-helix protein, CopG family [Novosphingobium resinovorum]